MMLIASQFSSKEMTPPAISEILDWAQLMSGHQEWETGKVQRYQRSSFERKDIAGFRMNSKFKNVPEMLC